MKGSVYSNTKAGARDVEIHRSLLNAVNFKKTKAFNSSVKRAESLGFTREQIKIFLGA